MLALLFDRNPPADGSKKDATPESLVRACAEHPQDEANGPGCNRPDDQPDNPVFPHRTPSP